MDIFDKVDLSELESDSKIESDQPEARPFFGQGETRPVHVLKKEEPQHRMICYLAAQGNTNTEIAELTGFTTAMVANTKKQPWAMQLIAEIQARNGDKEVKNILKGAAADAARTLVDAMHGNIEGTKPELRAKVANDILNRLYGTAPQVVRHEKVDPKELSDEELAARLLVGQQN